MTRRGRVIFGRMEEVSFGTAASDTIAEQVAQANATRVFLMVSGTLNRKTDEIEHVRSALGDRCAGIFDRMPAHTPRSAVVEASEEARTAQADLIVTIGGTSITDGAKAVRVLAVHGEQGASRVLSQPTAMKQFLTYGDEAELPLLGSPLR